MNRSKILDVLLYAAYIVFFISIICAFRAVSSISLGGILIFSLLKNKADTGSWCNPRIKNRFNAACCLFYLVQVPMLLQTADCTDCIKHLQKQSAVLFIPLAVCCSFFLNRQVHEKLMQYYIWTLAAVMLCCILTASFNYISLHAGRDVFFYHALVRPFQQHAVQVSIYLFICIVYLLEKVKRGVFFQGRSIHFLLIFYFTACLLLLSSKLVITFLAGCFVYYFLLGLKAKKSTRFVTLASLFAGLAMIALVATTHNRVSSRFNEIVTGDLRLVEQPNFNPNVYFNGLQFRLLQWRFVKEILTEQHAWLTGISGNAQLLLDNKYLSTHMYTGNAHTPARGYLGYNTHNEFLESLLQSGIPGLVAFLLICWSMLYMIIRKKSRQLSIIVLLLLAYCFNDAVLETQYGAMLFTFFPLFFYYGGEEKPATSHNR